MCPLSLYRRSSRFGRWRNDKRKTRSKGEEKSFTQRTQRAQRTPRRKTLQIEGAVVGHAGLAGVGAFDAADAEEFLTAAFQVGFNGFYVGRGHDQDHAEAHVEGLQQLVGFDFSEGGEKFEDGRDRPGREIDLGFYAGRKDTRQVAGDSAAGDVRETGNPAAGDDVFKGRSVAQVRLQKLRADFVAHFGDIRVRL